MLVDRFLRKFSLFQSLLITVVLSLLIPIPIVMSVYINTTYEMKQKELVEISNKRFNLASDIFAESLWHFYPELSQITINQLILDKNFVSVELLDAHKKEFLSKRTMNVADSSKLIVFEKTLLKNDDIVGYVKMSFKKDELSDYLNSDLYIFAILVGLQAIFIVLVMVFLYYIKILKPMKRMLEHSDMLANKNLEKKFIWDGNDEINSLGRALEKTRISLRKLFLTLKEQNETLDEKVKQRTEELEEASKYKSEFLANMSHEIRTPMNAIVGMCHLISKTVLNDIQSNYITKIKDASSVLLRIINDILDFSKIEAGKMSIEQIPFDMHKEIRKSTSIFSILTKEKKIELNSFFVHTHRFYKGDPYRIMQILNNFLSNAIKFTTMGTVELFVKEELIDNNKSRLTFSVTDSGVGISKDKQEKLFTAFSQLDASTTRKHGGTGLGLYICTQLADMMDGNITFKSEEGVGSTFSLELELEKVEGADVQRENNADFFIPLNILLIDDNDTSIEIIKEYIRSFGFFITIARGYEEALELIEKSDKNFDLYIVDYHLPKINGINLYELLKQKVGMKIPAILITSDVDASLKSKAFSSGFERFLVKPINPSYLYDDITSLCEVEKNKIAIDHSRIDFSDKKILIVEDNDINLEVATYLLNETDAKTDIARNGFDAIEKVKQNEYDVILMDIQMPVMDGYESTAIIRTELKCTTPIVAMTANVMAHDIKKCLDVGMNEHIGKPLEVEDFYTTLLNIFGTKVEKFNKEKTQENSSAPFDKQGALDRLLGNEELWIKTLCKFYKKYEDLEKHIDRYLKIDDTENLRIYIHSLKGLSGTIGLNRLQEEAKKVEESLKNSEFNENLLQMLYNEHKDSFQLISEEVQKHCFTEKKREIDSHSGQELKSILEEFELALNVSSVSRVKKCIEKLSSFESLKENENFKYITIACDTFDFDMADKYVKSLMKEL